MKAIIITATIVAFIIWIIMEIKNAPTIDNEDDV